VDHGISSQAAKFALCCGICHSLQVFGLLDQSDAELSNIGLVRQIQMAKSEVYIETAEASVCHGGQTAC